MIGDVFGDRRGGSSILRAVEVRDGVVAVLDSGNDRLAIAAARSLGGSRTDPPGEADEDRRR